MSPPRKSNGDDLNSYYHSTLMQGAVAQEARDKAARKLEIMHSHGHLKPVDGWDPRNGSVLDAYLDILGLNDRPITILRPMG